MGCRCSCRISKGDLSGISKAGGGNAKVEERIKLLALDHAYEGFPVTFWDVWGEQGHPVRATISDMGPLLLARMLNLNEVQEGVLNLVFKIADEAGLLLLDLKDLQAMLQFVADNAKSFTTEYGNISAASVGAIQRACSPWKTRGENLFGEPMLNIADLMQTDGGKGVINILAADKLMQSPRPMPPCCCGCWRNCSRTCRRPEIWTSPRWCSSLTSPLLFDEAPKVLVDKVEQVVRLIRSKGWACISSPRTRLTCRTGCWAS